MTLAAILTVLLLTPVSARAAFITNQEAGMDLVFSQVSFGNTPVDIRWLAAQFFVAPNLLDIDTDAEVTQIFSAHNMFGPANQAVFYFIDTMSRCGGVTNVNFVGCGELPGNDFVVESTVAAGGFGVELLSHELGHNLGLPHMTGDFLMDPTLNGFTTLTAAEVAIILASPLVQTAANGSRFIEIIPVLVLAESPIPEPATLLLLGTGLGLVAVRRRLKKRA